MAVFEVAQFDALIGQLADLKKDRTFTAKDGSKINLGILPEMRKVSKYLRGKAAAKFMAHTSPDYVSWPKAVDVDKMFVEPKIGKPGPVRVKGIGKAKFVTLYSAKQVDRARGLATSYNQSLANARIPAIYRPKTNRLFRMLSVDKFPGSVSNPTKTGLVYGLNNANQAWAKNLFTGGVIPAKRRKPGVSPQFPARPFVGLAAEDVAYIKGLLDEKVEKALAMRG